MKDQKNTQHEALVEFHNKTEEILAKLKNPTQESAEKIFNGAQSPGSDALMLFTGYYAMSAEPGSFLSIDTSESYNKITQVVRRPVITISVSMDGATSATYTFGAGSTFDGATLTIPDVLQITFTRQYNNGILATFTGVVDNRNVTGYTQFNPIALSTFSGNYTSPYTGKKVLSIETSPGILGAAIAFDFGTGMREVIGYSYVPLMFVLTFNNPDKPTENYLVMLGTSGSRGLACFTQQTGQYAFTIPYA